MWKLLLYLEYNFFDKNFKNYNQSGKKKVIELLNEDGSHYFTIRVYEALERFAEIMGLKDIEFETIDDVIFYAIHLALTFIHIKDLKKELEEFESKLNITQKEDKVKNQ